MKAKIWLGMLAIYVAWGSTYLAIRFAVQTIPPFVMAGTRFLIAGSILYGWQRLAGAPVPSKVEWRSAAIVGALLLVGGNGGVTWAEQYVPSGVTALLVSTAPLWMVLIDALHPGGQKPALLTVLGVLVGFAGIVLLVAPGQFTGTEQALHPMGVVVLMLAALLWAMGSIYNRGAHLPKAALMGTGIEMLAGSGGFFVLATLTGEWGRLDVAGISSESLWGLAYLITAGALVGFTAYTWLLRVAPTPLVSTYAYVNPLVAVFLGNMLAHEALNARILSAAAIILSAVGMINLSKTKNAQQKVEILKAENADCAD